MRSGDNNFTYFPKNKLTKLANFVQFMHMNMFCLKDWGPSLFGSSFGYATASITYRTSRRPADCKPTFCAIRQRRKRNIRSRWSSL